MLHNLLPKKHRRTLTQEYYLRLATVASLSLTLAVVVGVFALVPTYVDVVGERNMKKTEQEERQGDVQDNKQLTQEVEDGVRTLTTLDEVLEKEKLIEIVGDVFSERPDGVTLIGFSYDRNRHNLTVEGVAAKRDLVAPYARTLENNPRFTEVPVPIADLAKKTDLVFRLSLTIAGDENNSQ